MCYSIIMEWDFLTFLLGLLMINVVCRDDKLKNQVFQDIQEVFPYVYTKDFTDDVNTVLYALPSQPVLPDPTYRSETGGKKKGGPVDPLIRGLSANVSVLQKNIKDSNSSVSVDLVEMLQGIKLVNRWKLFILERNTSYEQDLILSFFNSSIKFLGQRHWDTPIEFLCSTISHKGHNTKYWLSIW